MCITKRCQRIAVHLARPRKIVPVGLRQICESVRSAQADIGKRGVGASPWKKRTQRPGELRTGVHAWLPRVHPSDDRRLTDHVSSEPVHLNLISAVRGMSQCIRTGGRGRKWLIATHRLHSSSWESDDNHLLNSWMDGIPRNNRLTIFSNSIQSVMFKL